MRKGAMLAVGAFVAFALAVLGVSAPAYANEDGSSCHKSNTLALNDNAGAITLSQGAQLRAGCVRVHVSSANTVSDGADIEVFSLNTGVTLGDFQTHLFDAFAGGPPAAAAMVWINGHTAFYGGASFSAPGSLKYQVILPAGHYYAAELPFVTTHNVAFTVKGYSDAQLADTDQSIKMVEDMATHEPRFAVSGHAVLRQGWTRVHNTMDELHFAEFMPVKDGTTDADVQAFFGGTGPDPSRPGTVPSFGVLSPGHMVNFDLRLSPGTYNVACFIPDDVTGVPHAFLGMHKVFRVVAGHEGDD